MKFFPIIGVEVHIELKTKSKMFCSCSASHFGKVPNTQVCPVCLGMPGALPVTNKKAVEWTVIAGLALNCQIAEFSKFDRKNYFYPDLPKGYQITQYDMPLAKNGKLEISKGKIIRIRRVHLEEDTGKLFHEKTKTLIDFNRAGVPLIEIVTEPDINSSLETKEFLENLQQIIRYLGISQADMEKGQMRCEPTVNLKIEEDGKIYYTPLVELKNINSFRFVQKAIDYEIDRQIREFSKTRVEKRPGNKTTRGWDEKKGQTVLQREKEEASDYRYFPEPDIPPIRLSTSWILKLKSKIPELPKEKAKRFIDDFGLSEYNAKILVKDLKIANFFEMTQKLAEKLKTEKKPFPTATTIANWIINKKIDPKKISPQKLIETILSQKEKVFLSKEEIEERVKKVIDKNAQAVNDFKKGKKQALEFLIGQIVRETEGKVDVNQVRNLLLEIIS
jgi:aspartyl-tRNA(Asn)/glutamyl-tRNA(Gln) amidotransferase subunit B